MDYAILKTAKIKRINGVIWAGKHNTRERDTPNADPSKTPDNTLLMGAKNAEQLAAMWRDRAALVDRKIKADAVTAIEYMITASPEAFASGKANDRYLQDGLDWIIKRHGKENVLQAVIHRDETTPHLHVLVIPIHEKTKRYTHKLTKETTEKTVTALDAKNWLNGRTALQAMQDEFVASIAGRYGLRRGEKRTRYTYEETRAWAARQRAQSGGSGQIADPDIRPAAGATLPPADPLVAKLQEMADGKPMSARRRDLFFEMAKQYAYCYKPDPKDDGFTMLAQLARIEAKEAGREVHINDAKLLWEASNNMMAAEDTHAAKVGKQREMEGPGRPSTDLGKGR